MEKFEKSIDIRWADLDPNFHVLHSKYYDFGAYCRMAFLVQKGLTPEFMNQHNIGPILFREEAIFKREISFGDLVRINIELTAGSKDFSRWSMRHHIFKNGDKLSAIINVDGAWMDTNLRKLAKPPQTIADTFILAPRSIDFKEIPTKT